MPDSPVLTDPRDRRIAELAEENARLRAELAGLKADMGRKKVKSRYRAQRDALIMRGEWKPYVSAGPVRGHIRQVMGATGMTGPQFAVAAGLDPGTVSKILYERGRGRVMTRVAENAMKVTASTPMPETGAWAAATGSRRRLQALAVAGWSPAMLAEQSGMDASALRKIRDGDRQRITSQSARLIRGLYSRLLAAAPPQETKAQKIAVTKTRQYAGQQGWAPAGAWDDEVIDDPAATPELDWVRAPERCHRNGAELAVEIRELLGYGLTRDQAAERLNISLAAVHATLARHGQQDECEAVS